ncbi:MAG TPA: ROK family protein [Candidatus Binatia bacterium]|nr:ROK family protein [Candidatus Binatia bacterium]
MPGLVGIDLGGTSIRAAVASGPTAYSEPVARCPTPAASGPEAVIAACADAARQAARGTPDGIAIGIPGPLDPEEGIVFAAPHLPGFEGLPARKLLSEAAGCPVAIHNDSNLAGYAEWVAGMGRGTRSFVFVIVGTGIGGAVIVEGNLHVGVAGTAAEVGHVPCSLDGPRCGQGHLGCLEGIASGTGIARRAAAALVAGEDSRLRGMASPDASVIAKAARAGDPLAIRLYAEAGRALGRSFGGLINILGPEAIATGGGVASHFDLLEGALRQGMAEIAFEVPLRHCRVGRAQLGSEAGLVGAVAWAVKKFGAPG